MLKVIKERRIKCISNIGNYKRKFVLMIRLSYLLKDNYMFIRDYLLLDTEEVLWNSFRSWIRLTNIFIPFGNNVYTNEGVCVRLKEICTVQRTRDDMYGGNEILNVKNQS